VIVHVFQPEMRAYYDVERLWGDARNVPWSPGRKKKAAARTQG
jgi:ribosomal silencing factor RsfS